MDLAERSGLLHVNMGIESISPDTLKGMNKKFNKVERYSEMLANLRRRGISYSLNFIFGWDTETHGVFESTLDFLHKEKVPVAYFNILCPEKSTMFYEKMKAEGAASCASRISAAFPASSATSSPRISPPRKSKRTSRTCT